MERIAANLNALLMGANEILYEARSGIVDFWNTGAQKWLLLLAFLLGFLLVFLFRRAARHRGRVDLLQGVGLGLAARRSPEEISSFLWSTLFREISAPAASLYLAASPRGPFVLKLKGSNPAYPGRGADWEPEAVLQTVPGEPGFSRKGIFYILSFCLALPDGSVALLQIPFEGRREAERLWGRVDFLRGLLTPILAQFVSGERVQVLEERTREASVVSGTSQLVLSATLEPGELGNLLLDLLMRATAGDGGLVLMNRNNGDGEGPRVLASRGVDAALLEAFLRLQTGAGPLGILEGRILAQIGPSSEFSFLDAAGYRSLLEVPVTVDGAAAGTLMLLSRTQTFQQSHLDLCRLNTGRLGLCLKNRSFHEAVFREYKETLRGVVAALEWQNRFFEGHSSRVAQMAAALARGLGLSAAEIDGIRLAGECHDVGMIGVGDEILLKAGRLTEREYDLVKYHPLIGAALTAPIRLPIPIAPAILHHHERYDGFGYPAGLKGERIPREARILTVAEVFDALIAPRTYRQRLPFAQAKSQIKELAGTQLDPVVVAAFQDLADGGGLRRWEEAGAQAEEPLL